MTDLTTLDSIILDTVHGLIDQAAEIEAPTAATTRTAYAVITYFGDRDFHQVHVSEFGYGDRARIEALEIATRQAERFPGYLYSLATRTETTITSEWEASE